MQFKNDNPYRSVPHWKSALRENVPNLPTTYPKASPTEMMGLLVLLKDHKGDEDIARLADDLDLEIDEIFPSIEFAEVLGLVRISEGRATLSEIGERILAVSIRERKTLLRSQLERTTLFKALLRALDSAPEHRLSETEVNRLIEFTTAPADALVQNIINWGRYAELFRFDSDARVLLPARGRTGVRSAATAGRSPPRGGAGTPAAEAAEAAAGTADPPSRGGASRDAMSLAGAFS